VTSISEQAGIGLAAEHGHHIPGTPYTYYHGWVLRGETSPGTQVTHPEFGTGVIRQHHRNIGTGNTADVFFPVTGVRANFEVTSGERDPVDILGPADTALAKRPTEPDLTPAPDLPPYDETSGWFADEPFDRNLDGNQTEAISDYVSPWGSEAINSALRRGHLPVGYNNDNMDRKDVVHTLDHLISSYTLNSPATVYRGLSMTPALERKLKPGSTFSDKAYTSTSSSLTWASKFAAMRAGTDTQTGEGVHLQNAQVTPGKPVIMKITVPAGGHMAPGETDIGEYVLPRGGQYRVDSIESNAMAATMINVTALPKATRTRAAKAS
jgi:hypothetical protein